jgi:TetR/AcrR family transcriptional regulator of autoinduction and epiphytic fitness
MELYSIEMRVVKSPAGSLRAERATVTRRRILVAARRRFADAGYAATTLREIASEAGVAVQTVYAVFGSKANILRSLRESVVEDPAASEAYAAALAATDPRDALRAFARSIRLRWEAGHDIVSINTQAAATDPGVRAEVEAVTAIRRRGIGRLALRLGGLDPDLDVRLAESLLNALTLTEIFQELVSRHGWSADEYESWLVRAFDALVAERLPGGPAAT